MIVPKAAKRDFISFCSLIPKNCLKSYNSSLIPEEDVNYKILNTLYISEKHAAVGLPETSSRKPDPPGGDQQAIPPPGPRKPHRLLVPSEGDGQRCQPAMGQPAEEGGVHSSQT